jgi:hypothetical protein
MLETRRNFLMIFGAATASLGLLAQTAVPQGQKNPPPTTHVPATAAEDDEGGPPKSATKAVLEENDKDIKKKIEKLYALAGDLKAEVEKTDSAKILSLAMVKKAEEIEKLARDIKTRARG